MSQSRRIFGPANGPFAARIMLVGEAPGRLGAERTGVPFFGDRSGDRLSQLLVEAEWPREEIFLTNAVICNPRDGQGRNAAPTRRELANCVELLQESIRVVNPQVVVALGAVALRALGMISAHHLRLAEAVATLTPWFGRALGVLYHPGAQSAIHRPWSLQTQDARRLGRRVQQALAPETID